MNIVLPEGFLYTGQLKSQLVGHIKTAMAEKRMSQARLADELDLSQPKVSLLMNGTAEGFSVERLIQILDRLGYSITVGVGMDGQSLETKSSRNLYCSGISARDEEERPITAPTYMQMVLTRKQMRRMALHFQQLLENYGQDLDCVKLEMLKTENGEEQFDLHDILVSVYTSSKFSLYGPAQLDADED